ncbi:MAG TPA: putative motility protein [Lachnospiraceae bacterium]|nr:putative motility protein [Lachnospiraceae bacterium]
MDIPALSMAMAQWNIGNEVGTAMLAKSIDTAESMGDDMVKMMERSVTPELGGNFDMSV